MTERLLWVSGMPAWYTRELHATLDADPQVRIRYLFFPSSATRIERSYEQGALSRKAMVYSPRRFRACARLLWDHLVDEKAAILFCGVYPRGVLAAYCLARYGRCRKYYYSDANHADGAPPRGMRLLLYRWLLGACDGLMVMGTLNALKYRAILGPERYRRKGVIHMPYPHPLVRPVPRASRKPEGRPVRFLFVGRLVPVKNVSVLVEAAGLLSAQKEEFEFWVAGTGPLMGRLKQEAREQGLANVVRFLGAIPSSAVRELYGKCDVLVLASVHEPWGLVVNEALANGLPVIAPAWAGAACDLLLDGVNGVRLLTDSPSAVAEAMVSYIRNPERVIAQGRNAALRFPLSGKTLDEAHRAVRSLCR